MSARALLVIGFFWLVFEPSAQTLRVRRNALFDFMIAHPGEVQNIHLPREEVFIDLSLPAGKQWTSALLRNRKGLYLTINGTGRVYRAGRVEDKELEFIRVDSTYLSGYNNFSFEFSHRDTLFSLGGYGFWRLNGHLRYFDEGREWSIVPLDRENPFHSRMAYYDSANSTVFFIRSPYLEEYSGIRHDEYVATRLDLPNRRSRVMGTLLPSAGIQPGRFLFGSPSLGGFVIDDFRSIRLLDMTSNRVWKLRNKALADWIFGNSKNSATILFESYGTLYQYDRSTDRLDSYPLSKADFEPTSERIYDPLDGTGSKKGLVRTGIGVLVLATVATAAWLYIRKRKSPQSRTKPPPVPTDGDDNPGKHAKESRGGFDPVEVQLIELVARLNLEGKPCTVDHLNHVLGVARKSVEIQKKTRRDTLININRTFRESTGLDMDLLSSRRSEEDKRFYLYYIPQEAMEAYSRILKGKSQG